MILNPAVDALSPPPIPAAAAWMTTYDGAYGPPLDLSQAVPGYPPPPELLRSLGEAGASTAMAGYGDIEGEPVLREAYASHVASSYDARIASENVHITAGCNQAFVAAVMAVAGHGDTLLMVTPFYFNHESSLSMLGIGVRYVHSDSGNGFLPDIEAIRSALKGVRALAIVSPNNPTGTVYPPALLADIFTACREAGVWLIVDETYRDFTDQRHQLFEYASWQNTFIQLYSFSKSFCIPGHRVGAIVAGEHLVGAVAKIMDNLQICAPRAAQTAIAGAIEPLTEWRVGNEAEIERRATALRATLAEVPDWQISAMGAYFTYIRHPYEHASSVTVAQKLAEKVGVSCLPGEFFGEGQRRFLRFAFANVDSVTISRLAARLKQFNNLSASLQQRSTALETSHGL